jgi:diguanylate cyclase (GGDEF)-like protein
MSQSSRSVLVVDDDPFFRQLIAGILGPRGYEILEARSGRDAHQILTKIKPVLVICDYRLPDLDGMTFIQQFRDAGFNIPVVFVSGTFCDARTFSWLRNILKVSLVLQKPISEDLFLQQLEGLLPLIEIEPAPAESGEAVQAQDGASALKEEYDRLLSKFPDSHDYIDNAVEALARDSEGRTEKELIDQLRQLGRKLQVQNALNTAKQGYAKNLPGEWHKLSTAVAAFQSEPENGAHREEATGIAHQLRGTAGSLGFTKVSEAAGRLEEFLKTIDVSDFTVSEIIWSEVFRVLSEGELAVRAEAKPDGQAEEVPSGLIAGKLLALTEDQDLIEKLMFVQGVLPIEVVITDSASNALLRVRTTTFDSVMLDVRLKATRGYIELCRQIRTTQGHEEVPFAFVLDPNDPVSKSELSYIGCSAIISADVGDSQFRDHILDLMAITQIHKPCVLTVDDDEVLSSFIASVLAPEGLVVHTLKEPINILEKMEQCRPELVILDVMMPGLSGYDVCRLLRSKEEWKHVSILFLTSKSSEEGRASAFHAGADDFLSKPVLTEELTARVSTQIERVRSARRSSDKDEVTGCTLRQVFLRNVEETISLNKDQESCLWFFEIDDFDNLTTTHGVFATEAVLRAVGEQMRFRFKSDVRRGCWGDKTFVLYLLGESQHEATELINAFKQEIEALRFESSSGQFRITISVGSAQYPHEAATSKELIELSHRRLGLAKQEKPKAVFT